MIHTASMFKLYDYLSNLKHPSIWRYPSIVLRFLSKLLRISFWDLEFYFLSILFTLGRAPNFLWWSKTLHFSITAKEWNYSFIVELFDRVFCSFPFFLRATLEKPMNHIEIFISFLSFIIFVSTLRCNCFFVSSTPFLNSIVINSLHAKITSIS